MMNNLDDFLSYLSTQKRYSQNTVISYKRDLTLFFLYLKSEDITKIDNQTIQSYLSFLYVKKLSNASIARKLAALRSYGKYLSKYKNINYDFIKTLTLPKKGKSLPDFIHNDELEILLNLPINSFIELRNSLIVHLLYSTGLRLNELTNLKVKDYDENSNIFRVIGKGNKERIVIFSNKTNMLIKEYLKQRSHIPEPYLLLNKNYSKLSNRGVELILANISKSYLGHNKLHPHMLRHTFATKLLNKGMDIRSLQELLGHETLAATQIYTHIAKSELLELYTTYHPRGDNSDI